MDSNYVENRSQLIVDVPAAARIVLNRLVKGLGPQGDDEGIKDCLSLRIRIQHLYTDLTQRLVKVDEMRGDRRDQPSPRW